MAKSDYWRNRVLDLLRGQSITPPATTYVALWKGNPLTTGVEVSGTGYQRFAMASDLVTWNATQGGTGSASSGTTGRISNAVIIQYGIPVTDWAPANDPISHWTLMTAQTSGNTLYVGVLSLTKTVLSGDPALSFPVDSLAIYEV